MQEFDGKIYKTNDKSDILKINVTSIKKLLFNALQKKVLFLNHFQNSIIIISTQTKVFSELSSEESGTSSSLCTGWRHFILDQLKIYQPGKSAEPLFFSFPKKRQVRGCIPQWVQPLGGCCLGKERAQAMTPYFGMLIAARINPRSLIYSVF